MMYDTSLDGTGNMDVVLPIAKVTVNPNVEIDWGDGTAKQTVTASGNISHTYAKSGRYVVSVSGTMDKWGFASNEPKNVKLERCLSWGNTGLVSLFGAFMGASAMNASVPAVPATVSDISQMFRDCAAFNHPAPRTTSAVTNMNSTFRGCTAFNASVAALDTSKVQNMYSLFRDCKAFNQPVSNFDTSSATSMTSIFQGCSAFNQSVSSFNTSGITDMLAMFEGCSEFNQSVSSFDTSSVTSFTSMFNGCAKFNQSVANFDTADAERINYMFRGCTAFNQPLSNFDTGKATTMVSMFRDATAFNQDISHFSTKALDSASSSTGLGDFMKNATSFSTSNLDNLLKAWDAAKAGNASNNHRPTFATACSGAGGGVAARDNLQAAGWTFTMPADLP
jgi:surface protein